jgi:hypothetical protein
MLWAAVTDWQENDWRLLDLAQQGKKEKQNR